MQALAFGAGMRLKCSGVIRRLRGLSFQVCSGLPTTSKELKLAMRMLAAVRHQLLGCELICLRLADCGHGAMPCEERGFGEERAREPREQEKASGWQDFFHGVSSRIAALHAMIRQRPGDNGRLCFQYRSRHRVAQRRRRNILLAIPACAGKTGSPPPESELPSAVWLPPAPSWL